MHSFYKIIDKDRNKLKLQAALNVAYGIEEGPQPLGVVTLRKQREGKKGVEPNEWCVASEWGLDPSDSVDDLFWVRSFWGEFLDCASRRLSSSASSNSSSTPGTNTNNNTGVYVHKQREVKIHNLE